MFWKKLQNPYALVAQGFLFGGLLYFATHVDSLEARASEDAARAPAITAVQPDS